MRFTSIAALATAALGVSAQDAPATGKLGDALAVTSNPAGVEYVATLPDTAFTKGSAYANGGNVKGYIKAVAAPGGVGVVFQAHFENLPTEGGPFKFHLHSAPVPADGNCTATLAHLDPFLRGETPACNSSAPATCEVGDLSGKYGEVKADPWDATFTDRYASTVEGIGAFFGNRSFVFHYANKTRISCANFVRKSSNPPAGDNCTSAAPTSVPTYTSATLGMSGSATATGATSPRTSAPPPQFTGGAALMSSASMAGVIAAAVFLL